MSAGTMTIPVTAEDVERVAAEQEAGAAAEPVTPESPDTGVQGEQAGPEPTAPPTVEAGASADAAQTQPEGDPGAPTGDRVADTQRAYHESQARLRDLESQIGTLQRFVDADPNVGSWLTDAINTWRNTGVVPPPPGAGNGQVAGQQPAEQAQDPEQQLREAFDSMDPDAFQQGVASLKQSMLDETRRLVTESLGPYHQQLQQTREQQQQAEWQQSVEGLKQLGIDANDPEVNREITSRAAALAQDMVNRARQAGVALTPQQAIAMLPSEAVLDYALKERLVNTGVDLRRKRAQAVSRASSTEPVGAPTSQPPANTPVTVHDFLANKATELGIKLE